MLVVPEGVDVEIALLIKYAVSLVALYGSMPQQATCAGMRLVARHGQAVLLFVRTGQNTA
jgi:hypothetical protein